MKWRLIVGVIILLVAGFLRFYKLNEIPYGLSWDEAAFAYNGWAISLWHRDEYATFMPLVFKSFGDYKPPLLVYVLGGVYKLTGLQVDMVRIVSAVSGILTVGAMYYLACQLRSNFKGWPFLVMTIIGFSPWAIHFSRLGYEANIAVMLVVVGSIFLLKGEKDYKYWLISAGFYSLSLYAFHNAKITVPVILLGYLLIFKRSLSKKIKQVLVAGGLLMLLSLPIIQASIYSGANERGRQTLILFDNGKVQSLGQITSELLVNIRNQLSVNFWVNGADATSSRHMSPGYGVIYRVELVFLVIGLVASIRSKSRSKKFILWWFVAGLLPAILTHDTPHAVRSLLAMPAIVVTVAYGIERVWVGVSGRLGNGRWVAGALVIGLYLSQIYSYLINYHTVYVVESATQFQYGYKEVVELVNIHKVGKDKVIVTDTYGQPYIYFLLYNQITPEQFLFGHLSTFEFRTINWPENNSNTLFVATPNEIPPDDPRVVEVVEIPKTNIPVFVIAETD